MPVAQVSASVAAKYEDDFYFDSRSPQGRTLRSVNYSQERNSDGTLTERALAYKREVRCLPLLTCPSSHFVTPDHDHVGDQTYWCVSVACAEGRPSRST